MQCTNLTTKKRFWGCLLALGISSVSVQLVMIREIMSTFSGNELVIGLVIGFWLLFTGMGSALGVPLAKRARPLTILFWGHVLVALLPFGQIVALRALPLLWVRGEMQGLGPAIFSSGAILIPYCIVAGAMIPVAGSFLSGKKTTTRVYIADAIGDIAGGLLFSFIFVYTFSHWNSLILLAVLNLLAAAMMTSLTGLIGLAILAVGIVTTNPIDMATISWRFPGQQIIVHKSTPFAQLTISKTGKQLNIFQDAIPLFSTNDLHIEAKTHLGLCQIDRGANVLLIAGGVFGTIEEIAKHDPNRIDYVELDPAILDLDKTIGKSLTLPFVHVHVGDGRLFVKNVTMEYDAIIVDLPNPENGQLNRFYTQEFFYEVKSILSPGGILSFSLVGAENYVEEKGLAVNDSVYTALKKTFNHVLVFPGLTHYYLASSAPLTTDIADVLAKRKISTKQLVDYDLTTLTDPFRINHLRRLLDLQDTSPNMDLSPAAFGYLLDMWLKKTGSSKALLYVIFLLVLGFAALVCRKELNNFTIMTSGYAAMAFELSLIFLFQVIYGYVYLRMCIFITLFMIGSAAGAFVSGRINKTERRQILIADFTLVVLAVAAGFGATFGVHFTGPALFVMQYAIIPALIFLVAFATGCQFSAVSRISRGSGTEITGRLYVADLAGAACGTILTGLIFIPKIGIMGVLVSVIILKTISLGLNVRFRSPAT
ncbi:MAG: hypothetical protein JRF24_03915 [Deltaproteobacteria bacterium]|nr:hypothetical protein [Deltaproteobacteria bacterium]